MRRNKRSRPEINAYCSRADLQGSVTRRLEALIAVPLAHPQDGLNHAGGGRPRLLGPADEPFGRPLEVLAVGGRHVLGHGGVATLEMGADVTGHPLSLVEALHGAFGVTGLEGFSDQGMSHRVVVALDLDVGVDVDPDLFPLGELIDR